jgi:hypothetical protein
MTKMERNSGSSSTLGSFFNEMSAHELERFLDFVSRFLSET